MRYVEKSIVRNDISSSSKVTVGTALRYTLTACQCSISHKLTAYLLTHYSYLADVVEITVLISLDKCLPSIIRALVFDT